MQKLLSSVILFLLSVPAWAATGEMQGANAPVETVSTLYVVLFCLGFVAMVVGFFAFIWWNDKRSKKADQ